MKKDHDASGIAEVYCDHCGQERRHSFESERVLFNKKEYLETSFTCHWCGTHTTVDGANLKRPKMSQKQEIEFDFG